MAKSRVVSGMRPTGKLHLGHLVGALKKWVALQDQHECFYFVADWHALTREFDYTAPLAAKFSANARPIPLLPPVMRATCLLSDIGCIESRRNGK